MILAIGEILADLINENGNVKMYGGGGPFNVIVNAKQAGARVGFIGRVGKDPVGKFLQELSDSVGFEYLDIQTDEERNTTLAFVSLTDGERDFAFFRHDTADYHIETEKINFSGYNIIHLGSLMLSEKEGQKVAKKILKKAKAENKLVSFDVNFRMDLYDDIGALIKAYKPFIESVDILKFSDDEILAYTGALNLDEAIEKVYKKGMLLLITMGSRGSMFIYGDNRAIVESEKQVKPIDTTGAGDAFFGTMLAHLDGKDFTIENIKNAMLMANRKGAETTQFQGAVKL